MNHKIVIQCTRFICSKSELLPIDIRTVNTDETYENCIVRRWSSVKGILGNRWKTPSEDSKLDSEKSYNFIPKHLAPKIC